MNSVGAAGSAASNKVIVTKDGKKYEKAGFGKAAVAAIAADMVAGITYKEIKHLGGLPIESEMKNLSKVDKSVYKGAVDDILAKSGLAQKGVYIIDATENNKDTILELVRNSKPAWLQKICEKNKLYNKVVEKVTQKAVDATIKGENAFYADVTNAIAVNKDYFSIAAFHEMGHAINKNISKFGNMLRKMRAPFVVLSILALGTAVFKRKKAEGEEPKGWFDKTTTFIKNNCGKLAFLGMLPTLAEEGMASINTSKIAKGVLSPEHLKKLNVFNTKAWLTYAVSAVGIGLSTYVASKIRDDIAAPKEIKQ